MTTDRDRVEAAIDAFYAVNRDDWRDSPVADATFDMMSRALAAADALASPVPDAAVGLLVESWRRDRDYWKARALEAADALAPPPVPLDREAVARAALGAMKYADGRTNSLSVADAVLALLPAAPPAVPLDRDAVAEAIEPGRGHAGAAYAAADRVLALLSAPPPVPEDVRWDWRDAWCAYRDAHVGLSPPKPMDAFVAGWEALRQLPAPPADTGDEGTLTRRVCELEEALRECLSLIRLHCRETDDIARAVMDRARAIIGGSHE